MKKLLLVLVGFTLFGCAASDVSTPLDTTEISGTLEAVDGLTYEFGDIDINGGIVSREFAFANQSDEPLYIYEATTSCGCTTGEIVTEAETFGPFGMRNESQSTITIDPNETFKVRISYDPMFHGPTDLGVRQRSLFLFTSAAFDGIVVRQYEGQPNFTEMSVSGTVVSS